MKNIESKRQAEVIASFETQVSEVVQLLKQGKFNTYLEGKIDKLWSAIKSTNDLRGAGYYKAAAIVSETKLYFGDRKSAAAAIEKPSELFESLQKSHPTSAGEKVLAREQVRAYQAWVHTTQYYDHDYESAKTSFEFCRHFINTKLSDQRYFGTKAQTEFLIGKVLRQLHSYRLSEKAFADSIEFYNLRSEKRKSAYESLPSVKRDALIREEAIFLNRKIAISILALAWLDYTRGLLSLAHREAEIAKGLLMPCEDPINDACIDWIRASILRCREDNVVGLAEALRIASQAELTLKPFKKHPYVPRIKYEKALINLALARLSKRDRNACLNRAWQHSKSVMTWSRNDERWKANSLIVMSRLAREGKDALQAIKYSTQALKIIEGTPNEKTRNHILCEIDAYIARAEAKIVKARSESGNDNILSLSTGKLLEDARNDLNEALKLNAKTDVPRTVDTQNEKTFAVAWLNISRSYVIGREKLHAEEAFKRWKDVESSVEHRGVHILAEKIRQEIDSFGDYSIRDDEPNLDYRWHLGNLRAHLIRIARQRMPEGTQEEWAKELRIARQSFIEWSKPKQANDKTSTATPSPKTRQTPKIGQRRSRKR